MVRFFTCLETDNILSLHRPMLQFCDIAIEICREVPPGKPAWSRAIRQVEWTYAHSTAAMHQELLSTVFRQDYLGWTWLLWLLS